MRTIKELLILVRDNLYLMKDKHLASGLCSVASVMEDRHIISMEEYNIILKYLDNNKPANAIKRASLPAVIDGYQQNRFWWKPCNITPRLKWLDKQINSL